MTDDDAEHGTPDTDPNHIDPAGEIADMLEEEMTDAELTGDTEREDLREFIDAVESGDLGPVDPGLEAQVRMVLAVLDAADTDGEDTEP